MTGAGPSFSPSVVLLVHETGESVLRQLGTVLELASLHPPLAEGIALLHVEVDAASGAARATRRAPAAEDAGTDAQPASLAYALLEAVRQVRSWETLHLLKRAGYTVAATVDVYVVGAADDPWLGTVLTAARRLLERGGLAHTICYLLDNRPPEGTLLGPDVPPAGASERDLPDFTFVFGDRVTYPFPAFVSDDAMRHYLMAEALFALAATGVSLDRRYRELVEGQSPDPMDKVGSLRTCLVCFPRAAVERFCAAGIGRDLVESCIEVLATARVDESEASEERERAARAVAEIWSGLEDSEERPGSDPDPSRGSRRRHLWPTLEAPGARPAGASSSDSSARTQLVEATGWLFELFERRALDALARRLRRQPWTALAGERARQAPDFSLTWASRAEAAWLPVRELLERHVRDLFDERWNTGDRRMALGRVFLDECAVRLNRLADLRVGVREQHHQAYREGLAAARERSQPWLESLGRSSFAGSDGTPSATPVWGGRGAVRTGGTGLTGDPSPAEPEPERPAAGLGHLLNEEETRIGLALGLRARALRALVPAWPGAVTASLLALATVGLPLAFVQGVPGWRLAAAATGGSMLLGALLHLVLRSVRRRRARAAETDLLRFHCLCYAHRGEQLEDRQRILALGPVGYWVRKTLRSLDEVESYLGGVRDRLEAAKSDAEDALFESPAAPFDVLVAEGGELRRASAGVPAAVGQVTLEEVLGAIRERAADSTDPRRLLPEFLDSFRDGCGMLEMNEDELRDHILRWVRERVLPRCLGGAAPDVYEALGRHEVRRRLGEQLQSPLFDLRGVMQPAERYVCGRWPSEGAQEIRSPIAGRPIPVLEDEWWLLAALFGDTAGRALDRDLLDSLFPVRPDAPLEV